MVDKPFYKTPVGLILMGAIFSEIIPDLSDPAHFLLQNYIFTHQAVLSKGMFIFLQIIDWYFLSAFFWFLVLILAYILHIRKVSTINKITILGAVISVSAVVSILLRLYYGL